jgi:hypothetical protein
VRYIAVGIAALLISGCDDIEKTAAREVRQITRANWCKTRGYVETRTSSKGALAICYDPATRLIYLPPVE